MTQKALTALRIDPDLLEAMRELKERRGVPVTTQFELAARAWLKREYGISVKSERRRAGTRKRS